MHETTINKFLIKRYIVNSYYKAEEIALRQILLSHKAHIPTTTTYTQIVTIIQ